MIVQSFAHPLKTCILKNLSQKGEYQGKHINNLNITTEYGIIVY